MKTLFIIILSFSLTACGACYIEDKNKDGTWPSWCGDRFNSPNPTKK